MWLRLKLHNSSRLTQFQFRNLCIIQKEDEKLYKRKMCIFAGYNGSKFCGSLKQQQDVETIEKEIETALFKCGMIRESNYGTLSKIKFSRATRTDKGVHAVLNCFSAKLLIDLNKQYDYIIPTYLFNSKIILNFNVKPSEENSENQAEDMKVLNKITIDQSCLNSIYSYRIDKSTMELLSDLFHQFEGTHYFHNYSRKLYLGNPEAQRFVISASIKETFIVSDIEFIRLSIRGQSFLFNQIRKMIGALFLITHFDINRDFITHSLNCESIKIPIVPSEGLILDYVSYENYNNKKKFYIPELIKPWDHKLSEINQFKLGLIDHICKSEIDLQVYLKWVALLHYFKDTFVNQPGITENPCSHKAE